MGFQIIQPKARQLVLRYLLPKADQAAAGIRELQRSMGTRDRKTAAQRLPAMSRDILAEVEARKRRAREPGLIAAARLAAGRNDGTDFDPAFEAAVEDHLERLRRQRGYDPQTGNPNTSTAEDAELRAAHAIASGQQPDTLRNMVDRYMAEKSARARAGTLDKYQRRLDDFVAWAGPWLDPRHVDLRMAGLYVSQRVAASKLAAKSQRQWIIALNTLWKWAMLNDLAEVNPWQGQSRRVSDTGRGNPKKRAWTVGEIERMLRELPDRVHLREAVALAAFTGCRIEELARMRVEHVTTVDGIRCIEIGEAKTEAGQRTIPLHSTIAPLVEHLIAATTDGYLLDGLKPGGRDNARSHYLSKRFGAYRAALGLEGADFHSFRRAFITALESAGVPESTAKLLSGHARHSLTFGLYSRGVPLANLAEAVEKAGYGPGVADAVSRLVP